MEKIQFLQKLLTKALILIVIAVLIPFNALATNTYTTVLDLSSTQYWSIAQVDITGIDLTSDFTLETWVNIDQLPSSAGSPFSLFNKGTGDDSGGYRFILLSANDGARLYYWDSSDNRTYMSSDAAIVVADDVGNWVHLAVSVDVSSQTAVFYKNTAVQANTNNQTNASAVGASTDAFYIGQHGANNWYMDGKVDDSRVWSDIRSGAEISDNYNCSLDGDEAGLEGYWRFDNNGTDSNANGNDLTNNNSATFQSGSLPFTDSCSAPPPPAATGDHVPLFFN